MQLVLVACYALFEVRTQGHECGTVTDQQHLCSSASKHPLGALNEKAQRGPALRDVR